MIKKDSKIGRILKQLLRERERIKIQCVLKTNFFVREMGKKYFKTNSLRGRENIQNTMRFKTNSFVEGNYLRRRDLKLIPNSTKVAFNIFEIQRPVISKETFKTTMNQSKMQLRSSVKFLTIHSHGFGGK